MNDNIRLGIMSTASINTLGVFAPCLKRSDIQLYALGSRNPQKAQKVAQDNKILNVYDDYEDVLDDKNIDAVYISLPNNYHYRFAKRALKAGKHVLCEKPIVLRAQEIEQLVKIAKENKLCLMDGLHYRYYNPLSHIINNIPHLLGISGNVLDHIKKIEGFIGFPFPESPYDIRLNPYLDGGATAHLGCYLADFIYYAFPQSRWILNYAYKDTLQCRVDLYAQYICALKDSPQTQYHMEVSLKHDTIVSWVKIHTKHDILTIHNAFTPTTFYDANNPTHSVLSVHLNDNPVTNIIKPNHNSTSYDFQMNAFINNIHHKSPIDIQNKTYQLLEDMYFSQNIEC